MLSRKAESVQWHWEHALHHKHQYKTRSGHSLVFMAAWDIPVSSRGLSLRESSVPSDALDLLGLTQSTASTALRKIPSHRWAANNIRLVLAEPSWQEWSLWMGLLSFLVQVMHPKNWNSWLRSLAAGLATWSVWIFAHTLYSLFMVQLLECSDFWGLTLLAFGLLGLLLTELKENKTKKAC